MQKAVFDCVLVSHIPPFPSSLSTHGIALWSLRGKWSLFLSVSTHDLLPPDTAWFHLLGWQTAQSSLILWWCLREARAAETLCRKWERGSDSAERILGLVGAELQSIFSWRGSAAQWGRIVRGQGESWCAAGSLGSAHWVLPIKPVASFGNESSDWGLSGGSI